MNGRAAVEVEVDRRSVAQRWAADVHAIYGYPVHILPLRHDGPTKAGRYRLRVLDHATDFARQIGIIDRRGQAVRGLPPRVVRGGIVDTEAVLRAGFVAAGGISDPQRATAVIAAPSMESAVALTGAARRLDITTKLRNHSDDNSAGSQVVIADADTITVVLTRLGAPATARTWAAEHQQATATRRAGRIVNFDTANARRVHVSAAVATARVRRAFEILGDSTPSHLVECGLLRLEHPQASLDELGRLADPPMTKDATSGRIRRLLAAADTHAKLIGVPDTAAAITPELLEQL